jgi:hypothetical protein
VCDHHDVSMLTHIADSDGLTQAGRLGPARPCHFDHSRQCDYSESYCGGGRDSEEPGEARPRCSRHRRRSVHAFQLEVGNLACRASCYASAGCGSVFDVKCCKCNSPTRGRVRTRARQVLHLDMPCEQRAAKDPGRHPELSTLREVAPQVAPSPTPILSINIKCIHNDCTMEGSLNMFNSSVSSVSMSQSK